MSTTERSAHAPIDEALLANIYKAVQQLIQRLDTIPQDARPDPNEFHALLQESRSLLPVLERGLNRQEPLFDLPNRAGDATAGTPRTLDPLQQASYTAQIAKDLTLPTVDLGERKRADETLRRSEEMLRRAERMAHLGTWSFDVREGVFLCSEEGARICGVEPGARRAEELEARVHPEDLADVQRALRETMAGAPLEMEHRLIVEGRVKWLHVRGEPEIDAEGRVVRILGVTQEITTRRLLEEQFRQAQKMEAVGRLAGGIAHDFNNMLAVINGYSELLQMRTPPGDLAHSHLAEIRKAGEQAQALTGQLLLFSRRQAVMRRVIRLNDVILGMEKMLCRLLGEDVLLSSFLAPDLAPVLADPGQIEQVLMNLAINARDAMPGGGTLIIETGNVRLDEARRQRGLIGAPSGDYVVLGVTDTGSGMDAATLAHIFEPFYTTKEAGVGTGLGLATVYSIVEQCNGDLHVYSEPGWGASFKIYLPQVTVRQEAAQPEQLPAEAPAGTETILVVEDDSLVRGLVLDVLESYGYTLLQANSGEEAVRLFRQNPASIDLVITDVVMPLMSGKELSEAIHTLRPEARVLFMSGYTEDAILLRGISNREETFLQKPFAPNALARKVREVLDGPFIQRQLVVPAR